MANATAPPAVLAPELTGNSVTVINTVTIAVTAGVLGTTILAYYLGSKICDRLRISSSVVQPWVVVLLLVSYGLLIPGLFLDLFSFDVSLHLFGMMKPLNTGRNSVIGVIQRLYQQHNMKGVVIVAVYALVIPAVKVALLIAGSVLVRSSSNKHQRLARRCLKWVQGISKWACPDMFAYILITILFRTLNNPPKLFSDMRLDVGFVCFTIFCLGSTVSSLCIPLPKKLDEEEEVKQAPASWPSWRLRLLDPRVVMTAVGILFVSFAALLSVGMVMPCMNLRMDLDLLFRVKPQLKPLGPFLRQEKIDELLDADVSIVECLIMLVRWTFEGQVVHFLAFIMVGGFAIALTIADMLCLMGAALQMCQIASDSSRSVDATLAWAGKFKELSMLDVTVMGVVVVVLVLIEMREKGLILAMDWGLLALLLAELCHCATYYLVTAAAAALTDHKKKKSTLKSQQPAAKEGDSGSDTTSVGSSGEPRAEEVSIV